MIPKIREVHVRNYKSIAQAVVRLSDLTVLVGPNGSGKTNFVDALAFVQECLAVSVSHAMRERRGTGALHRRGTEVVQSVWIRLMVDLDPETMADYGFEISTTLAGTYRITRERCVVSRRGGPTHRFSVREGKFEEEIPGIRSRLSLDRLALYAASGTEEFRGVFDFLTSIRLYRIHPEQIARLQDPDPGLTLNPDGGNSASVLRQLEQTSPHRCERISRLLGSVVAGLRKVQYKSVGGLDSVWFEEDGVLHMGASMSEGTLRLLGILLAVYQPSTPSVLIVEEPEVAIHPAAAEVVMSVLMDAAKRGQVVVTTHSPDILDHKALGDESIRVVSKEAGETVIAPISASSREAVRQHLYTLGELLRSDELNADLGAAAELARDADPFGPARTGEAA